VAEWLRRSPGAYFDLSRDRVKKKSHPSSERRDIRLNIIYNILTEHVFSSPQQLINNATKCDEFTFVQYLRRRSIQQTLRRMSYHTVVFIVAISECALHARVRTSSSPTLPFWFGFGFCLSVCLSVCLSLHSTTDKGDRRTEEGMSTRTFYARRAPMGRGGDGSDDVDPSTSDDLAVADYDDNDYDDYDDDSVDDVDASTRRGMMMMMNELRTARTRMAKLDASHRARTVEVETRRRREAEESAKAANRADATRLRANAARAERRMEEATEAERQLRVQNGDLRRKLERCAKENKRLVMELGRLKEKLATRRRGTGTPPTTTTTSSAPDAHVSMEYHEAVMRGFDQKVAALIDEIESLRRDGRGSRTSRIEPTPTTPSNERQRLQTNDDDVNDDDGNHQNDENVFPPSPFSPNLAPLDALLDKLSAVNAHASKRKN